MQCFLFPFGWWKTEVLEKEIEALRSERDVGDGTHKQLVSDVVNVQSIRCYFYALVAWGFMHTF